MHWLAVTWAAVWPNLLASILWTVPAVIWHHRRTMRHLSLRLEDHHANLAEQIRAHWISGEQ